MRNLRQNRGFYNPGWIFEFPVFIIAIILLFAGSVLLKRGLLIGAIPCNSIGARLLPYWTYVWIMDYKSFRSFDVNRLQPCPRCESSLKPVAWREEKEAPTLLCKYGKYDVYYNVTRYGTPIPDSKSSR